MFVILISFAALVFTFLGGLFALKFSDKLHLILGFSAGAIIGVAFFDLLPEALELTASAYETHTVSAIIALGFIVFMLLDRFIGPHPHAHEEEQCENDHHKKGSLGAASLAFHSFLDGAAIGVAFHISSAVGTIVAVAVLIHKFSDGINTVGLILRSGGGSDRAMKWLWIASVAPVVGILFAQQVRLSESTLGVILALFCGFFLHIGASDLLPESHHKHRTHWTTISTLCGFAVIYVAVSLVGLH